MYVCMYVCMYICVCVCVYCIWQCTEGYIHPYMHTYVCVCVARYRDCAVVSNSGTLGGKINGAFTIAHKVYCIVI